jgi:uncharacterized protein YndB with AHSA1/START domain
MSEYGVLIDATTLRFVRLLPGPIERVWDFIVDADKRSQWFCAGKFDLRPGGLAEFRFDHRRITDEKPPEKYKDHGCEIGFDGVIVEAIPPRFLIFEWPDGDEGPTVVRIELEEIGERVRLTLTHSRLPSRDYRIGVSGGWHRHLDMLEAVLAGAPRPSFWGRTIALENEYAGRD